MRKEENITTTDILSRQRWFLQFVFTLRKRWRVSMYEWLFTERLFVLFFSVPSPGTRCGSTCCDTLARSTSADFRAVQRCSGQPPNWDRTEAWYTTARRLIGSTSVRIAPTRRRRRPSYAGTCKICSHVVKTDENPRLGSPRFSFKPRRDIV